MGRNRRSSSYTSTPLTNSRHKRTHVQFNMVSRPCNTGAEWTEDGRMDATYNPRTYVYTRFTFNGGMQPDSPAGLLFFLSVIFARLRTLSPSNGKCPHILPLISGWGRRGERRWPSCLLLNGGFLAASLEKKPHPS